MNPLKNKIGPDIDVARASLDEIKRMGLLGLDRESKDFRWIVPKNLPVKTIGPNAEFEVVYYQRSLHERQRIVRHRNDVQIDSVLCVRFEKG